MKLTQFSWRWLYQPGMNYDLIEECVQDVFLRAYLSYDQIVGRHDIQAWLYKTLIHRLRYAVRQQQTRRKHIQNLSDVSTVLQTASLSDEVDANELLELIQKSFTDRELQVFKRYYILGYQTDEIANDMGTTRKAIRRILERLRVKAKNEKSKYLILLIVGLLDLLAHYDR